MTSTPAAPRGIGVYARLLSTNTHGTPDAFAQRLKANGASFVAFLACWQDKKDGKERQFAGGSPAVTRQYAEACHKQGIQVWLWGFPWVGREQSYMQAMVSMARALPAQMVRGFIHDPEVSYRDRNAKKPPAGSRGQGEADESYVEEADQSRAAQGAEELMRLDRAAVAELALAPTGVTSYGMADWHALPWRIFADGGRTWGSPQLYTVTPAQVDKGLESWNKYKFSGLIPSVPGYGRNSGPKLDAHLAQFVNGEEPEIDGFLVWSYQQVNSVEWAILKRWAAMLAKKAC